MQPFWQRKKLIELTDEEWESLCDGCGRCCLKKLQDETTAEVAYTDVACKLQYPDMPSTVDADLKQLKLAMSVYKRIDRVIEGDEIYAEIAERLREELDYEREAAQLRFEAGVEEVRRRTQGARRQMRGQAGGEGHDGGSSCTARASQKCPCVSSETG